MKAIPQGMSQQSDFSSSNGGQNTSGYSGFQLVGHDSPLGDSYPCPIVPIIRLEGRLAVVYAGMESDESFAHLDDSLRFTRHNEELSEKLKGYDYRTCRLFGLAEDNVVFYEIEKEPEFFQELLSDPEFSQNNPFMRLSLAEAQTDSDITMKEIERCIEYLKATSPSYVKEWYSGEVETFRSKGNTELADRLDDPVIRASMIEDTK